MDIQPNPNIHKMFSNPELSLKLQQLGVLQQSFSYWATLKSKQLLSIDARMLDLMAKDLDPDHPPVSAFTSDELINMLGSVACGFQMDFHNRKFYQVHYKDPIDGMLTMTGNTLPDALALMLIRLLSQRKKPLEEANRWLVG
jgi:hypothetical protein